jgi:hypothetical protein
MYCETCGESTQDLILLRPIPCSCEPSEVEHSDSEVQMN